MRFNPCNPCCGAGCATVCPRCAAFGGFPVLWELTVAGVSGTLHDELGGPQTFNAANLNGTYYLGSGLFAPAGLCTTYQAGHAPFISASPDVHEFDEWTYSADVGTLTSRLFTNAAPAFPTTHGPAYGVALNYCDRDTTATLAALNGATTAPLSLTLRLMRATADCQPVTVGGFPDGGGPAGGFHAIGGGDDLFAAHPDGVSFNFLSLFTLYLSRTAAGVWEGFYGHPIISMALRLELAGGQYYLSWYGNIAHYLAGTPHLFAQYQLAASGWAVGGANVMTLTYYDAGTLFGNAYPTTVKVTGA
jgi:hypothetical protein